MQCCKDVQECEERDYERDTGSVVNNVSGVSEHARCAGGEVDMVDY